MKSAAGQYRLRIAMAAINPTVGDLPGNSAEVARAAAAASAEGAHLIVFPEMVLTGYPIEDLALRPSFRAASKAAIDELAQALEDQGDGDLVAIVGYLDEAPSGGPQNVAAVIHRGEVRARYIKTHWSFLWGDLLSRCLLRRKFLSGNLLSGDLLHCSFFGRCLLRHSLLSWGLLRYLFC